MAVQFYPGIPVSANVFLEFSPQRPTHPQSLSPKALLVSGMHTLAVFAKNQPENRDSAPISPQIPGLSSMAKPLTIYFRSGQTETYRSLTEAAAAIGIPRRPLAEAINRGSFPFQSKYQAIYDAMQLVQRLETPPLRTGITDLAKEGQSPC